MAAIVAERNIRFGIRGIGGEIGDTTLRTLMAMRRDRFNAFGQVTGGRITALVRGKEGLDISSVIRDDRSYAKLNGLGTLEANTASSYGYTGHISEAVLDATIPGRLNIYGADGRVLAIDYVQVPETNADLQVLNGLDYLLDATGVGLKPKDVEKNPLQDPNLYAQYPGLTTFFSAPNKSVKGIHHHLNGLELATPAQLNATGSCSTHAGVDYVRTVRETIIRQLGLGSDDMLIEGGLFDADHSLTPSDMKYLQFYDAATVPQTTGFGSAAASVYPVPTIKKIDAATHRYNSFFHKDGVQANGASFFSLSLTISVKAGSRPVDADMIRQGLMDTAMDREGRKHIGIINSAFSFDDNKKKGIFTGLSLSGMTPTAMLPLGDNISVTKIDGTKVVRESGKPDREYDIYIVNVKNVGYDNRLGFTVDMMDEMNRVAQARFGTELFPGFYFPTDLGMELAFHKTAIGQALFAKALQATSGSLLVQAPII